MFEAVFEQASLLKKLVEAIKELTDTACFEVTSTGISCQAMDTSHVSLVTFVLKGAQLAHFRCDRSLTLGLNLKTLTKLLKTAGNEDKCTLKAEEDGDRLTIMIEAKNGSKTSSYEIKMMDITQDSLGVSDAEYKAVLKMNSEEFMRICRDMSLIGDTVQIEMNKEAVSFTVTGEETSGTVTLRPSTPVDDDAGTSIEIQEPLNLSFALRFLNFFTKASPLSEKVTVSLSPDQPLCVSYDIGDMGNIRYFLAPKIEDEASATAGSSSSSSSESAE
nr:proliferating cell nuclear antigen [Paratrimastix eleionoma]